MPWNDPDISEMRDFAEPDGGIGHCTGPRRSTGSFYREYSREFWN
jgi:hypothetical protein